MPDLPADPPVRARARAFRRRADGTNGGSCAPCRGRGVGPQRVLGDDGDLHPPSRDVVLVVLLFVGFVAHARRHGASRREFDGAGAGDGHLPAAGGTVTGGGRHVAHTHQDTAFEAACHGRGGPVGGVGPGRLGDVEVDAERGQHGLAVDVDVAVVGKRMDGRGGVLVDSGVVGRQGTHRPVGHPSGPERRAQQRRQPRADLHGNALGEIDLVDLRIAALRVAGRLGFRDRGTHPRFGLHQGGVLGDGHRDRDPPLPPFAASDHEGLRARSTIVVVTSSMHCGSSPVGVA